MASKGPPQSRYERLKQDTDAAATWLVNTASSIFKGVKMSGAQRRHALKDSNKPESPTLGPGRLRELADQIITRGPESSFKPTKEKLREVIIVLQRCIFLRKGQTAAVLSRQTANPSLAVLQSNAGHDYFTESLQYVHDRLKPLLQSTYAAHQKDQAALDSNIQEEALKNLFEHLELFESVDQPAGRTKGSSKAAPAQKPPSNTQTYHVKAEDDRVEAFVCLRLLLQDLEALRGACMDAWNDFAEGKAQLPSVAIAHNTAIDFARALEEDAKKYLSKYGDILQLLEDSYAEQCKEAGLDPRPPSNHPYFINPDALHIAEPLLIVSKRIVQQHLRHYAPSSKASNLLVDYPDVDDPEYQKFMIEQPVFPDNTPAWPDSIRHYSFQLNAPRFLVPALQTLCMLEKTSLEKLESEGGKKGLAIQDELSRGLGIYQRDGILSLWLVFAFDMAIRARGVFSDSDSNPKRSSARAWTGLVKHVDKINTTLARHLSFYQMQAQPDMDIYENNMTDATFDYQALRTTLDDEFNIDIGRRPVLRSGGPAYAGISFTQLIKLPAVCGLWHHMISELLEAKKVAIANGQQALIARVAHAVYILQKFHGLSKEATPELTRLIENYNLSKHWSGTAADNSSTHIQRHGRLVGGLPSDMLRIEKLVKSRTVPRQPSSLSGKPVQGCPNTPLLDMYRNRFSGKKEVDRVDWSHSQFSSQMQQILANHEKRANPTAKPAPKHKREVLSYAELVRTLVPCLDHEMNNRSDDPHAVFRRVMHILRAVHDAHWPDLRESATRVGADEAVLHDTQIAVEIPWAIVALASTHALGRDQSGGPLLRSVSQVIEDAWRNGDPGNGELVWNQISHYRQFLHTTLESAGGEFRKPAVQGNLMETIKDIWYAEGADNKRALQRIWLEEVLAMQPQCSAVLLLRAHYAVCKCTLQHLLDASVPPKDPKKAFAFWKIKEFGPAPFTKS